METKGGHNSLGGTGGNRARRLRIVSSVSDTPFRHTGLLPISVAGTFFMNFQNSIRHCEEIAIDEAISTVGIATSPVGSSQ